jgi:transcriptional regulator with XRE-family HTH domain
MTNSGQSVGDLLRRWRQRRRLSQLEFACDAEISTKHLSFVETGRSMPSREMVLHLAEQLDVPTRERNVLLVAAGYAPMFPERSLQDDALDVARRAIDLVLDRQRPYPAFALDRHWQVVASNAALPELYTGVAAPLTKRPVNALRISLHPDGLAPRIANFAEWRAHLLARLRRQIDLSGDPALRELLDEILAYKLPDGVKPAHAVPSPHEVLVPLRIMTEVGLLSFVSTTTVFATPLDITLSELAVELFFAADAATDEAVRRLSREAETRAPPAVAAE